MMLILIICALTACQAAAGSNPPDFLRNHVAPPSASNRLRFRRKIQIKRKDLNWQNSRKPSRTVTERSSTLYIRRTCRTI